MYVYMYMYLVSCEQVPQTAFAEQTMPAPEPHLYVSIRQHTSAYVSIRQHMAVYGSLRREDKCTRTAPIYIII